MRMKKLLTFLTLLTLFFGVGWAAEVDETLTYSIQTSAGGSTGSSYSEWTWGFTNGTIYSCQSAGSNNSIQLRSSNNNSGIVSTSSIGTIKKVVVTWNSNTANGRTLDIYGKNSAYSSPSDLYGNNAGTKIGSIVCGTGTSTELSVTDSYAFIGLRSNSGAMYITSVTITWETGGSTVETVATPTFSPEEGTFTEAQNVTIACATDGATIYYTTDGTTPTTSSSVYSSAIPVSETTTIKALAVKSGMNNSAVASATYTINIPGTGTTYERVTSLSSSDIGKKFIFVCENYNSAAGTLTSQYLSGQDITISNHQTVISDNSSVIEFTLSGSAGAYQFADPDGNYLTPTAAKKLSLNANGTETADITFSNGNVNIAFATSTYGTLQYNYNNGSNSRFLNYTSSQTPIQLYRKVESTPEVGDVYIIGQVNGHDSDSWVSTEGVQMTYNSTNDNYAANIYCTGVNTGDKSGYSFFLFAKSLPYDWSVTSNLYGSGAGDEEGAYWGIGGGSGESAFGEEIPLYEGSKKSYRLPAGLYTVTVDLDITGVHQYTTKSVKVTKRDVIMTISPNSATFETTKNVTMSSNLTEIGGKIYYTTNGNDPRDPNSGRIEYTGELTIDATTTFKAVAFIGNLYSEVVEKTYIKTPAAPVIIPNGGTIYEATQVTITAEEGANIYYTTDGSAPTSENGTLYEGPFTVSATTTVKARAYVGDVYSSVTTAEFTYSNVQPSTGDFVLVTSASQLVAGNEYIIMSSYEDDWEDVYNVAFGAISSNSGTSLSEGFTVNGNIGESGSTVSLTDGSSVNVLTLGGSTGAWNLKQSNDYYIVLPKSDTKLSTSASACSLVITIGSDYVANIQNNETTDSRQLRYYITSNYFRNYTTSQGKTENVYLYTRESNSVQPPVFTPAGGVYDVPVDVTISCATTGASIYYTTDGTEPSATNGTLYNGAEFLVSETTTYKAVAVKNGNTSSVVTAEYTIAPHTAIETVTLDYSEPFTAGIGKFTVQNVSGFAPVWTLDGEFGIKGTSYSANTNPTNNAAESRFLSPIIDMTDATQPELTFSHQINSYFTDVTNQCQLFIRETTDGTDGAWVLLPITFSDPAANGGWTNDVANIDLSEWAGKKVQISFLYTNPTEGSGAGTWEIQHFVVADNSEYKIVNNIAEFLALPENTKAKFRNPVTVLYDYAQYSHNSYHEYIWVKDESGYMQFYLVPTLNSGTSLDNKAAYYENGDIIPGGFVVTKNYYTNGKYIQAFSDDALNAGFQAATQKGLADPEYMDFDVLDDLDASNTTDVANWSNHYITLEKIKLTSSSKNFNFQDENGTTNSCVGYNKYNGDGSLLKGGTTSADVIMPTDLTKFYNVKAILQLWQGGWEIMPIEFTEWKTEEVTLRKLCADGVEQNTYTISNPLQVVYVDTKSNSVWVKDGTGQSIWSTSPAASDKNFAVDYPDNTRSQQAYYDQSNWCQLVFDDEIPTALANLPIINGGMITGKFTNKMNPTLENVELGENFVQTQSSSYATNYYMAANFNGPQLGYFFMNPKPQEYADIVWAIYDSSNQTMIMANNSNKNPEGFEGSFKVNMSMNINPSLQLVDGTQTGKGYEHFHAIIRLTSTATSNAPMLKDRMPANTEYVVYPLDITQDVPTGITDVNGKAVKSVKYVNVAGVVSDKPFSGVNIVVTEYTDGSRSTTKMLRK